MDQQEDVVELEGSSPHSEQADATSSSPSFPFFNHSAATLPNNLPPNADDKPMARQKRKRTSPEDQAVLEAYYARDPKPDKAARLDLVKKVALGEKEVQIWFQNRRQSSRRKSRPLLPHEIAQYQLSKSVAQPDLSPTGVGSLASRDLPEGYSQQPKISTVDSPDGQDMKQSIVSSDSSATKEKPLRVLPPMLDFNGFQGAPGHQPDTEDPPGIARNVPDPIGLASGISGVGRGSDLLLEAREFQHRSGRSQAHPTRLKSPRRVKTSSSFVRLSLNSEGTAKVVANDSSSPSPPRPVATSQHCGNTVDPTSGASLSDAGTVPDLRRVPSGRSRDSRAWEFWCDKDGRTELEEKAEKEASGSASDAIQLLRSSSGRNILGSLTAKRNFAQNGHSQPSKKPCTGARMPLQRSSTSNGRLQSKKLSEGAERVAPKLLSSKTALSVHIPGNDSDKENWSPNTDSQSGSVAGEDGTINVAGLEKSERQPPRHAASGTWRSMERGESIDPDDDPEIAAFMQAGRDSDKVSDHEEMDCVQGLLSLSQGNWR